jgi:thymidylate kinase
MIIDFIGAPAVGKSTFARALAERLRECGKSVNFNSSYRPAESADRNLSPITDPGHAAAVLHRLARPVAELMASTRRPVGGDSLPGLVEQLMAMLPPRSMIWSIRLHQYLLRLAHSWSIATKADQIIIFDQGFLQALCSLVVLGRVVDRQQIARAVTLLPAPDALIYITAPKHVLEQRLRNRRAQQRRLERLLELDLQTNLAFLPVIEQLDELLRAEHQHVIYADCTDDVTLLNGVTRTTQEVIRICASPMAIEA